MNFVKAIIYVLNELSPTSLEIRTNFNKKLNEHKIQLIERASNRFLSPNQ